MPTAVQIAVVQIREERLYRGDCDRDNHLFVPIAVEEIRDGYGSNRGNWDRICINRMRRTLRTRGFIRKNNSCGSYIPEVASSMKPD